MDLVALAVIGLIAYVAWLLYKIETGEGGE